MQPNQFTQEELSRLGQAIVEKTNQLANNYDLGEHVRRLVTEAASSQDTGEIRLSKNADSVYGC